MRVGDALWVLDDFQPVGALLDVATGAVRAVYSWPEVEPVAPPDAYPSTWRVASHGEMLWVQQPPGRAARIDRAGSVRLQSSGGRELRAVSAHGAWCLGAVPPQDVSLDPATPPASAREPGRVTVALDGGGARSVGVDAPAVEARSIDGDLFLLVETGQWTRRELGPKTAWVLEPLTQWLRLAAGAAVPDRFDAGRHAADAPPPVTPSQNNGGQRWGHVWLAPAPKQHPSLEEIAEAAGEPAGRWLWRVGRDRDNWHLRRHSAALAHDPVSGAPVLHVDLGPGEVQAMAGTGTHLWLAIDTPRQVSSYQPPAPARVVRLDARTGEVEVVLASDHLDITQWCWPMPPRPADSVTYEEQWRAQLVADWFTSDGIRVPTSRRAVLVGQWPDTQVHLLFSSRRHPGHRLRRKVPLYDELGRKLPPEYAAIHLDEDLASGAEPYVTDDSGLLDI
ncbi:MAG: hypothetical protein ACR2JO_05590 [Mycobacteriales bacterium]